MADTTALTADDVAIELMPTVVHFSGWVRRRGCRSGSRVRLHAVTDRDDHVEVEVLDLAGDLA